MAWKTRKGYLITDRQKWAFDDFVESLDSGTARQYCRDLWAYLTFETRERPTMTGLSQYGQDVIHNNLALIMGQL